MAVSKPPILRNGRKITEDIVVKGVKNTETVRNIKQPANRMKRLKTQYSFLSIREKLSTETLEVTQLL